MLSVSTADGPPQSLLLLLWAACQASASQLPASPPALAQSLHPTCLSAPLPAFFPLPSPFILLPLLSRFPCLFPSPSDGLTTQMLNLWELSHSYWMFSFFFLLLPLCISVWEVFTGMSSSSLSLSLAMCHSLLMNQQRHSVLCSSFDF